MLNCDGTVAFQTTRTRNQDTGEYTYMITVIDTASARRDRYIFPLDRRSA